MGTVALGFHAHAHSECAQCAVNVHFRCVCFLRIYVVKLNDLNVSYILFNISIVPLGLPRYYSSFLSKQYRRFIVCSLAVGELNALCSE